MERQEVGICTPKKDIEGHWPFRRGYWYKFRTTKEFIFVHQVGVNEVPYVPIDFTKLFKVIAYQKPGEEHLLKQALMMGPEFGTLMGLTTDVIDASHKQLESVMDLMSGRLGESQSQFDAMRCLAEKAVDIAKQNSDAYDQMSKIADSMAIHSHNLAMHLVHVCNAYMALAQHDGNVAPDKALLLRVDKDLKIHESLLPFIQEATKRNGVDKP